MGRHILYIHSAYYTNAKLLPLMHYEYVELFPEFRIVQNVNKIQAMLLLFMDLSEHQTRPDPQVALL